MPYMDYAHEYEQVRPLAQATIASAQEAVAAADSSIDPDERTRLLVEARRGLDIAINQLAEMRRLNTMFWPKKEVA